MFCSMAVGFALLLYRKMKRSQSTEPEDPRESSAFRDSFTRVDVPDDPKSGTRHSAMGDFELECLSPTQQRCTTIDCQSEPYDQSELASCTKVKDSHSASNRASNS